MLESKILVFVRTRVRAERVAKSLETGRTWQVRQFMEIKTRMNDRRL